MTDLKIQYLQLLEYFRPRCVNLNFSGVVNGNMVSSDGIQELVRCLKRYTTMN